MEISCLKDNKKEILIKYRSNYKLLLYKYFTIFNKYTNCFYCNK